MEKTFNKLSLFYLTFFSGLLNMVMVLTENTLVIWSFFIIQIALILISGLIFYLNRRNKWDTVKNSIDILLTTIFIFRYLNTYITHYIKEPDLGFYLLFFSFLAFRYLIGKYIKEYEINQEMMGKLKEINEELEKKIFYASELSTNLEKEVIKRTQEVIDKNKELHYSANYDVLTNIPNRRFVLNYIDKLILNREEKFALIILDIDEFKTINDSYGHDFGDKVIQYTGISLKELLRDKDVVARLGGDEFLIVIKESSVEAVQAIAQKLVNHFKAPYTMDNIHITTTISMGIALFPKDGDNRTDLMISSDVSLYKSKKEGRSRYTFFSNQESEVEIKKAHIERNLSKTIDKEHLKVIENIEKFLDAKGK